MIGTKARPRLSVYKSNKAIYAQLIDDEEAKTILADDSRKIDSKKKPMEKAFELGQQIAKSCKEKKIENIIFDRNGFRYHGQIKSLAEGIREGGIKV